MDFNVFELRNYWLQPDVLEHFIDYFETQFIATQEQVGMDVLGQFRVMGQPDHFVWLRAFENLATRLTGLQSFYGGPVWKKYGAVANHMMIDSDHVHLLRPSGDMADLMRGRSAVSVAAEMEGGTISPATGIIAVDFFRAQHVDHITPLKRQVLSIYRVAGIQVRGCLVTEMAENDFPRLPVIQNAHEWVVLTAYPDELTCQKQRAEVAPLVESAIGQELSQPPEAMLLKPTLRSPLRY